MKRINVAYLFAVWCILVSPSLTAPADEKSARLEDLGESVADAKDTSQNEVIGDLDDDTEGVDPVKNNVAVTDVDSTKVSGASTGIISRIGFDGPFECRKITCPEGTETCIFTSKLLEDGKNAEVKYKCTSSNGTVTHEETKTETAGDASSIDGFNFGQFFDEVSRIINDMFSFRRN